MIEVQFGSKNLCSILDANKGLIRENKNLPEGIIGLSNNILKELNIPTRDSGITDEKVNLLIETPEGRFYELKYASIANVHTNIELPAKQYEKLSSKIKDLDNIKIYGIKHLDY